MRSVKRWVKASAVLAAAALALSACGGGSSDKDGDKGGSADGPTGTLNVFAAYDTTNWNPSNTSSALAVGANLQVVEGLYEFDFTDFSAHKALAAEDQPTEVGDLTYEVKLRDGAKFSTGDAVTAEDVVTSFDRVLKGDKNSEGAVVSSTYAAFLPFIDTVEAKDDTTVTLKLKYVPDGLAERLAVVKVVPASATFDEMTVKPIGSGPYKYDDITPTTADLSVNEHYNGPNPATVKNIHYDCNRDNQPRQSAAISGTTDIVENVDPAGVKQLESAGWKVDSAAAFGYVNIMFNTTKAPFDNAKTRQGILTAIDKQTLIKTAMNGAGVEPNAMLPESSDVYKEASVQFDFDTDKAKDLLAEGGAEGATVSLKVMNDPWVAALGLQIKQNLEAAGLTVDLTNVASQSVWQNDVPQKDYDILVFPGDTGVFGADPYNQLAGWYLSDTFTVDRFFLKESDPATYDKFAALIAEADKLAGDERKAKWGEVLDLASETAAIYPLVFHTLYTAYNPERVSGVKAIGTTGLQLIGVKVND